MFYCVNVADKRKITNEKHNIKYVFINHYILPSIALKRNKLKACMCSVFDALFFFGRLNLEYFKLLFGEKKNDILTQFHYDPKSLNKVSAK